MIELQTIVRDFALSIQLADAGAPQAVNVRSKKPFRPGIGPHSERQTVNMVTSIMSITFSEHYSSGIQTAVQYADLPRQKCDICIGAEPSWDRAIEVKMLRMFGDNGKPNDNILMHILSPYPKHRSVVTDCEKLITSRIAMRKAILIYGYEADEYPMITAIDVFEIIAKSKVNLGQRLSYPITGLIYPVHSSGKVLAWEVNSQ